MNATLRTRLLIAISATIVVTLLATQYGLYILIRRQLLAEFDQSLGAKARSLAVLIEQDGNSIDMEFEQYPLQEYARSIRPEYYQVWHEDGRVLARSRQMSDGELIPLNGDRVVPLVKPLNLPDGRKGRAAGIRFRPHLDGELPEAPADGPHATALHDDLHDDDVLDLDDTDFTSRPFVTLVVARDTQELDASLAGLRWLLTVSGVLSTGVILGVLAWLVTRNLRPLQSLATQIGRVNEQTLNQRFALQNAPGELLPVVSRLNALMACLETAFLREKTFTADVAHEIRTPLAGIRSTLEVGLSRHREADSYRSSMEQCLQISEETETIISTLLSLSRIEAGQATLENDIVDLGHVIRKTWQSFANRSTEKGVRVVWNLDDRILFRTDHGKLQVVVSNLLDNATNYVNLGGEIVVSTSVDQADKLHIAVSNSGCSLTADQAAHACERFWRADSSRSETGIHSGLGLALTQRIVEFLKGQIEITVLEGWFTADMILPAEEIEFPDAVSDDEAAGIMPEGHWEPKDQMAGTGIPHTI